MKTFNCWLISCLEFPLVVLLFVFLGAMERYSIYFHTFGIQAEFLVVLSCLLAAIPAIAIAIYTFKNYDEVISVGMARWTSSTKLLEGRIKYSLNRMGASSAFFAIFLFMFLQFVAPNANYGFFLGYHPKVSSKVEKNADDETLIEKKITIGFVSVELPSLI